MRSDRNAPDVSVEELQALMPKSIREAIPQALWNKEKLWALDLPAHDVQVTQLTWLFNLPIWQLNGQRFQVKPNDVLSNPDAYPDHYQRILDSDLSYPIHITRRNGRLTILDGYHRLAKALVNGDPTIKAISLSAADIKSISVDRKVI